MKEISIALGGGGYKGVAHIGVLRALEKAGYRIKAIAGTSIGGLIGAVYAAGYDTYQIENLVKNLDQSKLFSRAHGDGPSIMGLKGVSDILLETLGDVHFKDLKIPFACTSVDIDTGQEYSMNAGRVSDAVLATIAIPGIFPPKVINGKSLVDGATLDPVPVLLARWLSPAVPLVAVCLHPVPQEWQALSSPSLPMASNIPGIVIEQFSRLRIAQAFTVFTKSIDITSRMLAEIRMQTEEPDVILRPDVDRFGLLEVVEPGELILAGETVVENSLARIEKTSSFPNTILRRLKPKNRPGDIIQTQQLKEQV